MEQNRKTVSFSKADATRTHPPKKRRISVTDAKLVQFSDGEVEDSGDEYQPFDPSYVPPRKPSGRVLRRKEYEKPQGLGQQLVQRNLMDLDSDTIENFSKAEFVSSLRQFKKQLGTGRSLAPTNTQELTVYAEFTSALYCGL